MPTLTEITCRAASTQGNKIKKLGDGEGLYLWVFENGSKRWNFRYKINGKQKGLSVGVYPKISLAEARKEGRRLRQILDEGVDPSEARKSHERALKQTVGDSFQEIAKDWYDLVSPTWKSKKHADDVLRRLEINIYPVVGKRPIAEIEATELLTAVRTIEKRGSTDLSHRMIGVCSQVFRYGIAIGKCKYDVTSGLKGALIPHSANNQPAIAPKDLPDLMKAINKYHEVGDIQTELGLKILAHTFTRTAELIEAPWDEFDFDANVWNIPKERMKMKIDHQVPLTDVVLDYLKQLKVIAGNSRYVFKGRNPMKSISNNTLLFALYRLGYKGKMTGHGFRSVASTVLNESGFNSDIIERQLAHIETNKVRGAYNRATYIPERRNMMNWWSDYLIALESGNQPNVITHNPIL